MVKVKQLISLPHSMKYKQQQIAAILLTELKFINKFTIKCLIKCAFLGGVMKNVGVMQITPTFNCLLISWVKSTLGKYNQPPRPIFRAEVKPRV